MHAHPASVYAGIHGLHNSWRVRGRQAKQLAALWDVP